MNFSALLYLAILISQCSAQCDAPSCDGVDPGTYITDPTTCSIGYLCLQGGVISDVDFICEDTEIFNVNTGECEEPGEGDRCQIQCHPVNCETECVSDFQTLAISGNCSAYYFCQPDDGDYIKNNVTCGASAPYFDSVTGSCSTSAENCCDNEFTYCDTEFEQIPDPVSCRQYYLCLYVGIPTSDDLYDCGYLYRYDEAEGCVLDDGICPESTVPPSTTSTTVSISTTTAIDNTTSTTTAIDDTTSTTAEP